MKTSIFCTCGSNNWETVEDRWVHAARGLTNTDYCLFILATFCVIVAWASPGQIKMKAGVTTVREGKLGYLELQRFSV